MEIGDVFNSAKSCKDKDRCNESLLVYGHGDGGGGPTIEMLERLRRLTDVDGLPRVQNRSPYEFFTRCEPHRDELLTWVGELVRNFWRFEFISYCNISTLSSTVEHTHHNPAQRRVTVSASFCSMMPNFWLPLLTPPRRRSTLSN